MLLNRPGPTSFADLKTIDGVQCSTYIEAATRLGLLESDAIYARAMADACAERPNLRKLQHYFAMLICHSHPNDPQTFFDDFLDEMNPPVSSNDPHFQPKSRDVRKGEVMRNLEYYLNCMGSSSRCVFLKCDYIFFLF